MHENSFNRKLLFRNGKILELGTFIKDVALSKTLERVRDNPEDFYTGALAEDIVKDIQDAGGIITLDDLANFKVVKRKALMDEIGDLTLYTLPAPSGGPAVTYILNILKGITDKILSSVVRVKSNLQRVHCLFHWRKSILYVTVKVKF